MAECVFELHLPPFTLEGGAPLQELRMRGWWSEPGALPGGLAEARARVLQAPGDASGIVRRPDATASASADTPLDVAERPTLLLVHALTGDMRAGGEGGWWAPLIGPGRPLDTDRWRILCFNNLGSCYGSSGPLDGCFPRRSEEPPRHFAGGTPPRGWWEGPDPGSLPATVTTWDQARAILQALDAAGIGRVDLVAGGSVGGMITLCLAMLAPERFGHTVPLAASAAASPWIIGLNHVGRRALLADPGWPHAPTRGLHLARMLAHMSYRAEPGLEDRMGRRAWSEDLLHSPYQVQTYLEHQGQRLVQRFDGQAYVCQLDAMDHHDMFRPPPAGWATYAQVGWDAGRLTMPVTLVDIDTDALYLPRQTTRLAEALRQALPARPVRHETLTSLHGHDAFLLEWDQLADILTRSLLP
jgi:homoserine O-acetyltransferase